MSLESVLERNIHTAYLRLDRSPISEKGKELIRQYIADMKVEKEIGKHREYHYLVRLRESAERLGDKFVSPTKDDLKRMIAALSGETVYIHDRKGGKRAKKGSAGYSSWTIQDYRQAIKSFYKWTGKPEIVDWIKLSNGSERKRPEDLITPDEMGRLAAKAGNQRDRALFGAMYDSGCRIGELLTLKNKHVKFDKYGAILSVEGKTGFRNVRVVGKSIAWLREWQDAHPDRDNGEAWFFCGITGKTRGAQLTHFNVYRALKQSAARAGIRKRIHPHLFRHTRATLLAVNLKDAPLEDQMGWIHGSKMTRTYVHLSDTDRDRAVLKAYGVEVEEEEPVKPDMPLKCLNCGEPNNKAARFCWKCGVVLDQALIEKALHIEEALLNSKVVSDDYKELIREEDEETAGKVVLRALNKILNSPEIRKQFLAELKH